MSAVTERYEPRGACRELWHCQAPEVLISGPNGTGKSLACLWKMHFFATRVPGFRGIFLRRTRKALTESALVTFERDVLPPNHPATQGADKAHRQAYHYPNGSEIVIAGLDQARTGRAIFSQEYDAAYCQEAIDLTLDDWQDLTTRLNRRRLPGLGYSQLMADTNPGPPTHWLKLRCDSGRCKLLESRHQDNPVLWDGTAWTSQAHNAQGTGYIDRLDQLIGPRRARLRFGQWVQAEGTVYEGAWDAAANLIDSFEIPREWPRLMAIDWGATNPTVIQWWAVDDDGRLYLYRQIYRSLSLVEDLAREARDLSHGEPPPCVVICDHDKEDRMTFERHSGWETTPADKHQGTVVAGIHLVSSRLRKDRYGRPRLFVLRDSLVDVDPVLRDSGRPWCTEQEFDSYVWDNRPGVRQKDQPLKKDDHGMDALRYLVWSLDSDQVPASKPALVIRA